MRLLLDSHAFLWLAQDDPRLSAGARSALVDPANSVYLSTATIWELAIKESLGKLKLEVPLREIVEGGVDNFGLHYLDVNAAHAHEVSSLPKLHGDPFDRLLIAQVRIEKLQLVSRDPKARLYGVPVLW